MGRIVVATGLAVTLLASIPATPLLAQDAPQGSGNSGVSQISDTEADEIIADIDRAVGVAAEELEQFRSDRLDQEVVLAQTGNDPDEILDWVKTETSWVPYLGTLRGAAGTLMDRTGNSLDRSLLLLSLLEEAGFEARLANATLPEDVAVEMLGRLSKRRLPRLIPEPFVASADEIEGYGLAAVSAAESLVEMVGLGPGDDTTTHGPTDLEVITDHWWVQANINGTWRDFDALVGLDDGRPAPQAVLGPDDIPDALRHAVTVRVVVERWGDDGISSFAPLEYTYLLGTGLPDRSFELTFDASVGAEPDADIQTLEELSDVVTHWRPVLNGDSGPSRGDWFSSAGVAEDPSTLAIEGGTEKAVSALDALGGDEPEAEPTSELSAVWLEYESSGPQLEPRVERRELVDLLGAERRFGDPGQPQASTAEKRARAAAMMGVTTILVQDAAVDDDALYRALLQSYVDNRNAFIALVFIAAGREDERITPALVQTRPQPLELMAMAMARSRWLPSADSVFLARPNIWSDHLVFEWADDQIESFDAVDIVINDVDVRPTEKLRARQIRLEQGVLDTLVEHVLATDPSGDNTWARFDEAREGPDAAWSVVRNEAELQSLGAAYSADDRQRMLESLSRGDVVVADPGSGDSGSEQSASWWRIASTDGTTVGIGNRGWGQEIPEEGSTRIAVDPRVVKAFQRSQANKWVGQGKDVGRLASRIQANAARARGIKVTEINEGVIVRVFNL